MDVVELFSGREYYLYGVIKNYKCPVREYIDSLDEKDKKQIIALILFIANNGIPQDKRKFNYIGDKIYELKTHRGVRILCFKGTPVLYKSLILTHGFKKPKNRVLMKEKEKALLLKKAFFSEDVEIISV